MFNRIIILIFALFFIIAIALIIKSYPKISLTNFFPPRRHKPVTITLPDTGRKLPVALKRLDRIETQLDSNNPKIISSQVIQKTFNTIDEEGKYFLYGIYQTSQKRLLASGIVNKIEEKNGLQIKLIDEFRDKIAGIFILYPSQDGNFPVGVKNTANALDFRKEIKLENTNISTLAKRIENSKVVIELEDNQENQDNLTSLSTDLAQSLEFVGKAIYLKN